jgi:hypothetical protein
MRNVANALIDQLDVADEAAVVFTSESWSGQSFTSNRWKLRQAVARVRPVMGGGALCAPAMGTAGALRAAAQALASVPRNRKAVLYVGADGFGLTLDPGFQARGCGVRLQADAEAAVRAAQLGNVAIYTFDTYQVPMRTMLAGGDVRVYQQPSRFLGDLAASTGGEHFTVPDDLAQHVPDVLEATSMYYLLGYEAVRTPAKGPFHSLEVKVTRPGVVVRSRATRYDPAAPESQPSPTPAVSATETGIAGFLPTSALRIEAATAAFAGSDGSGIVRVALNVELPDALRSAQRDVVDWLVRAYTIDGHAAGSVQNAGPVRLDDSGPKVRFGMDTVISLKPGRYTLRIAVHSKLADKTGSVYADVDMPDFAREPLAMSGVVVTDTTGSFLAGDPLTALAPTASREFATDDRAQIFLRVYEGGSSTPVAMTVRLINEDNAVVVNQVDHLPAAAFSHGRQANYWYRLPLSSLRPGEYWLSLEAAAGLHTARRDIRFRMRP